MHRNIVAMTDTIRYNGPKFAMVPEWLLFDPNVSMAAKTVYAALADWQLGVERTLRVD